MNCEDDTYTPAFEWTSTPGSADLGTITHIIEDDSTSTEPFVVVSNTILGCFSQYLIYKDDGTGTYIPYTDSNASIDNVAFDNAASPTEIVFTTSVADDNALDTQVWKIRVSVMSKTPISAANYP